MSDIDLVKLKELALAATPGRVGDRIDGSGSIKYQCVGNDGSLVLQTDHKNDEYGFIGENSSADEKFFRACDPLVIIALIEQLEAAQRDCEELVKFKSLMEMAAVSLSNDDPMDLENLFQGQLVSSMFALMFAGEFVRSGAKNYLELLYAVPDFGDLTVTIQKVEGKTPGERIAELEAELKRRDAQEPVTTKLVYSSVLPNFIGDTDEVESYSCFIHGNTPPRKTMEEAYADAKEICGPLYAAAPAALLPPEVTMTDCVKKRIDTEFMAGYNQAISDAKALGCQPAKVVTLPSKVNGESVEYGGSGAFTMGKQCGINEGIVRCAAALDAAGVKWVEGE